MKKTLKIEIVDDDGVVDSNQLNNGFSRTELIGLLRLLEMDIIFGNGESCR